MPETTEITTTDPFAEIIAQIAKDLQAEKAERTALYKHTETLAVEARQLRKARVRMMLLDANECLRNTQEQSPAFVKWLQIQWPILPRIAYDRRDTNPPTEVLKLFGDVVSSEHLYGWICLVRREDKSLCVEILVQLVRKSFLQWDESVFERLPVSFDQKLQLLAEPTVCIEVVLRALLDCPAP